MNGKRIGIELGMLNNLIKRQMAMAAGPEAGQITGMQAMIVHYLIQAEGEHFQRDVETQFRMRRSTATGILQLMEKHGLLRREPVEHDARLKRLVLTDRARALDKTICAHLERTEQMMRQGVSEEELAVWFKVCGCIRANLEKYQSKASEEML